MPTLPPPMLITSRLMAGVQVGDCRTYGTISINPLPHRSADNQQVWEYYIDIPGKRTVHGKDLQSGVGATLTPREAMGILLAFLGAFAEASNPGNGHASDNADLFPNRIAEWAYLNSDEIDSIRCQLEPTE